MNTQLYRALVILLTSLLASCGGGSASSGRFIDGPVTGLRYTTPTLSGTTNAEGMFFYEPGETVSFYVGDILIGQAVGAATLTPFNLAGTTPPVSGTDIHQVVRRINATNRATPFEVAANIAVFLQTLDEDGDADNGQQIPAAIHTLAAGITLNFAQGYEAFYADMTFRKLMAAGRAAGLWKGARAIRDPLLALDTLYSGLGLTPMIDAIATFEIDTNGDGTVDSRLTYSYDPNGNKTLEEHDHNGDGIVDSRSILAYDTDGYKTLQQRDSTNNIGRSLFKYDANGNWTLVEDDVGVDGTVNSRTSFRFDVNGRRTMEERDSDADGSIDSRVSYTYDDNGKLSLREYDDDANGSADSLTIHSYDDNGNQTLEEFDSDADGMVDHRTVLTYDGNNNLTLAAVDNNGDSTADSRYAYSYDANGNKTLLENDYNVDGAVDYRETYSFDTNNNLTQATSDHNADGSPESRTDYTYDADNNLILLDDVASSGTVISRITYAYDANGNLTRFEVNAPPDGHVYYRTQSSYTGIYKWRASGLSDLVSGDGPVTY